MLINIALQRHLTELFRTSMCYRWMVSDWCVRQAKLVKSRIQLKMLSLARKTISRPAVYTVNASSSLHPCNTHTHTHTHTHTERERERDDDSLNLGGIHLRLNNSPLCSGRGHSDCLRFDVRPTPTIRDLTLSAFVHHQLVTLFVPSDPYRWHQNIADHQYPTSQSL